MATLLLWVNLRHSEPEDKVWAALVGRARGRSLFDGVEMSGPGYRLFAAATRAAEPEVLVQQTGEQGNVEILMFDRAQGADDSCRRADMLWNAKQFLDGTPSAVIRIALDSLEVSLYRDLMGQRALVYARINGGLIAASGEDVLRAHPEVSGDLDEMYLASYFAGVAAAPEETVFRDVRALASGETLIWNRGSLSSSRKQMHPDTSWREMSDTAVVDRFRELFLASVRDCCLGARRVGISLSAGMDSSSIAAAVSQLPQSLTHGPIGVTYGFDRHPEIDERGLVEELTRHLGIGLRTFAVDDVLQFADTGLRPICPDTPFQWLYREWTELVYRQMAQDGIDVCLNGGFGDHVFWGSAEWLVDALRFRRWGHIRRELARMIGSTGIIALLRDTSVRRPVSRLLGRVSVARNRTGWLKEPYCSAVRERTTADIQRYRDFPRPDHCALLLSAYASFEASNENWYSQRHAIERRLPFADPKLVQFCLSLPADFNIRNGQKKWLLREALQDLLPTTIRRRAKSSSLAPAFSAAWSTQRATLATYARGANSLTEKFYLKPPSAEANDDVMKMWLAVGFGAWSRTWQQQTT